MNRYEIFSKKLRKVTHGYMAEEPMKEQPEWSINGEYEVLVTDLTEQRAEEEAKKEGQIKKKEQLLKVDWDGVKDFDSLKEVVKSALEYFQGA